MFIVTVIMGGILFLTGFVFLFLGLLEDEGGIALTGFLAMIYCVVTISYILGLSKEVDSYKEVSYRMASDHKINIGEYLEDSETLGVECPQCGKVIIPDEDMTWICTKCSRKN